MPKKKEDRESAPVCNDKDAVSVYRQQEKEGSVRVCRIAKEEGSVRVYRIDDNMRRHRESVPVWALKKKTKTSSINKPSTNDNEQESSPATDR